MAPAGLLGFVRCVAERFEAALSALRLPRHAKGPPVQDDLVGKEDPFIPWNDLHQVALDLGGFSLFGEIEAQGQLPVSLPGLYPLVQQ